MCVCIYIYNLVYLLRVHRAEREKSDRERKEEGQSRRVAHS